MAQSVETLRYSTQGRRFNSQLVLMEFFIDIKSFRPHYGPGVNSAPNGNEYLVFIVGGKGGRCVEMTLPLSRPVEG